MSKNSICCTPSVLGDGTDSSVFAIIQVVGNISAESMVLSSICACQIELQFHDVLLKGGGGGVPAIPGMEEMRQLYRKTRGRGKEAETQQRIRRLQERLFEKDAQLEEAKDALVDQQHSQRTRDIVMLASPTNQQKALDTPGVPTNFAVRREGILVAEVSNMKNELTRAEADNKFLSNAVKSAVQYKGKIPDTMYREAMRICERTQAAARKVVERK